MSIDKSLRKLTQTADIPFSCSVIKRRLAAYTFGFGLLTNSLFAQTNVINAVQPPAQPVVSQTQQDGIQQVQATYDGRRALDSRIQSMPRSQRKLDVIHNRSQYVVTNKRVTRIAISDPEIVDIVQYSPLEFSILGTGLGTTDLWLWFEEEGQEITEPLMYTVTTIRDPELEDRRRIEFGRIERKLQLLYPNSKVYLIPVTRKVIVRGQAKDASEAAKIMSFVRGEVIARDDDLLGIGNDFNNLGNGNINNGNFLNDFFSSYIIDELQVPGEFQISVRVRIAELSHSQLRRWGMDWSTMFNQGAYSVSQSLTGGAGVLTGVFDGGRINAIIDALASNGSARVVEDARLVVLSGRPAAFLSGGEFAVPTVVGIGGAQGQQTSFRGFGTSIITTPTVIDDDLIRLTIIPELSSVSSGNAVGGIPGLNVRRVQTEVELREGQTIVLGGVFSRRETAEVTRIPFLGEIPHIGSYIFNAKQATEDQDEILIVVTPEIVRAMDADQVPPMPGFYVTHPDDIDFYKYNRIEGNPDMGNYQLLPYGNGQGYGQDVGYNHFNPPPAGPQIAPSNGYAPGMIGQPQYQPQPQYMQPQITPQQQQLAPVPPATSSTAPRSRFSGVQQTGGTRIDTRVSR